MTRAKKTRQWYKTHTSDHYVKQAQHQGLRSRASFKLQEIQTKDELIKPGMRVLDLGAAPGGWSECCVDWVGRSGKVVGIDLLPIDPIVGVDFFQEDFTLLAERLPESEPLAQAMSQPFDVILSDMAPDMSGIRAVDQLASIGLCEEVLDFATRHLKPGGDLLIKVFQGEGTDDLKAAMRASFEKVVVRKPKSSRPKSREVYFLGKNLGIIQDTISIQRGQL